MERIILTETNAPEAITKAVEVLQRGGVILYPTDTLYGLGADALSNSAVDNIYKIKGRDPRNMLPAIAADLSMVERYAQMKHLTRMLAQQFWPGPLTLILNKQAGINGGFARMPDGGEKSTVGFRVPNSKFCIEMVRMFRKPITSTSANLSGKESERTVEGVLLQLGEAAREIDLVIDAGELPESLPSTVVDLSGEDPKNLREGAIPAADIWQALGPVIGNLGI